MRWQGRKPVVRGVAMNPIDHPHGGGEGRTSGGRHPVTPWGKPTKGKKTRPTRRPTSSSCAAAIRRRRDSHVARSIWKGPFVDGYLLKKAEKARGGGPQRGDQDLVPPLDHPAAIRRPHLRRPQRPKAHPGARHRGHDRPQVRRVRADADLLRPRRGQEGQEGSKSWASRHANARSKTTRRGRCAR